MPLKVLFCFSSHNWRLEHVFYRVSDCFCCFCTTCFVFTPICNLSIDSVPKVCAIANALWYRSMIDGFVDDVRVRMQKTPSALFHRALDRGLSVLVFIDRFVKAVWLSPSELNLRGEESSIPRQASRISSSYQSCSSCWNGWYVRGDPDSVMRNSVAGL